MCRHAQLKLSVSSLLNVPMTGTAYLFSLSYFQTNSDRRKISKKRNSVFSGSKVLLVCP